jgi:hypothetical protein
MSQHFLNSAHIYSLEPCVAGTPEEEEKEEPVLSSESEPQVSERAAVCNESPVFGSPSDASRRVQFQIGMPFHITLSVYTFLI